MALKTRQWLVVAGLLVLVISAVVALFLTRDTGALTARIRPRRAPLVDEQPVQTARNTAALATTREEQRFAQQALRLADHAVDLAFADAMREATLHPPANVPEAKELFARVNRAEAQLKSDQEIIDRLKKEFEKSQGSVQDFQQQLDLLQAQAELDKDELEDARASLLRSGADSVSRVQRQFARYQAQQQADAANPAANLPRMEEVPQPANLIKQIEAWRNQYGLLRVLQQARDEALQKREQLKQRNSQTEQAGASQSAVTETQEAPQASAISQDQAVITALRRLSERHKELTDLKNRIQDHQDIADVYGNWMSLVHAKQLAILHGIFQSLLIIVLTVLAAYVVNVAVDQFFVNMIADQRRMRTLRMIVRFVIQAAGALIVVWTVFGVPSQMTTILGLAGAGLTVALKDFIVAFIGWFVLMGRNGIRIGDWVEIEGVVGEVAEIGLLRTVLLETGNWNDVGHPTGRKVAFVNSYAIEGHYFNFSTSGQWLWDELQILVPSDQDPYPIIDGIQKVVATATEPNARSAQEEWKRATRDRMHSVSAEPAINLRPTASGVEVHIRYITRAQERYATRTKLYQQIADLLHQRSEVVPAGQPQEGST